MKMIRRKVIESIEKEIEIEGITYLGLVYKCPRCKQEVLEYQDKCDCGQRLRNSLKNIY